MKRALLVIDVQNEYFPGGTLPISYPPDSLKRITDAMDGAAENGIPIVVVQHGTDNPDASSFNKGKPGWRLKGEGEGRKRALALESTMPGILTGRDHAPCREEKGVDASPIAV